ncbi:hypothetical protein J4Q44_G00323130 [Coregonus suidteri]|uniref:Uncharacterized protein n=1 Tax=Coregonus suidteri TaxID=861788 RepID=A0AAN8L4N3_9TELE
MPDTVLEGGGVLDSPETELSPKSPSTGGSLPLDSSSPWPGSSPPWHLSQIPRPFSPTPNPPSRRTLALCPATPSTSTPSPRLSSNGRKRKTAEAPSTTSCKLPTEFTGMLQQPWRVFSEDKNEEEEEGSCGAGHRAVQGGVWRRKAAVEQGTGLYRAVEGENRRAAAVSAMAHASSAAS